MTYEWILALAIIPWAVMVTFANLYGVGRGGDDDV